MLIVWLLGYWLAGWLPARTWQTHRELLSQIAVSVELTAQSLLWVTNRTGEAGRQAAGRWLTEYKCEIFPRNTLWHLTPPDTRGVGVRLSHVTRHTCFGKFRIISTTQLPFFEHRRLRLDEWCKSQPTVECLSTSVRAQCFFAEVKTSNCSCPAWSGDWWGGSLLNRDMTNVTWGDGDTRTVLMHGDNTRQRNTRHFPRQQNKEKYQQINWETFFTGQTQLYRASHK